MANKPAASSTTIVSKANYRISGATSKDHEIVVMPFSTVKVDSDVATRELLESIFSDHIERGKICLI